MPSLKKLFEDVFLAQLLSFDFKNNGSHLFELRFFPASNENFGSVFDETLRRHFSKPSSTSGYESYMAAKVKETVHFKIGRHGGQLGSWNSGRNKEAKNLYSMRFAAI
jgi:hypothetical protein